MHVSGDFYCFAFATIMAPWKCDRSHLFTIGAWHISGRGGCDLPIFLFFEGGDPPTREPLWCAASWWRLMLSRCRMLWYVAVSCVDDTPVMIAFAPALTFASRHTTAVSVDHFQPQQLSALFSFNGRCSAMQRREKYEMGAKSGKKRDKNNDARGRDERMLGVCVCVCVAPEQIWKWGGAQKALQVQLVVLVSVFVMYSLVSSFQSVLLLSAAHPCVPHGVGATERACVVTVGMNQSSIKEWIYRRSQPLSGTCSCSPCACQRQRQLMRMAKDDDAPAPDGKKMDR